MEVDLVPYSSLLYREGEDGRNQIYFKKHVFEKRKSNSIKALLSTHIEGWLFILQKSEKLLHQCCLFNPVTLQTIPLPSLILTPKGEIEYCISLPAESLIIIFPDYNSLMFCRVGDQKWTEQRLKDDGIDFIRSLAHCDGKLYLMAFKDGRAQLAVIDQNIREGRLVIRLLGSIPSCKDHSDCLNKYLVESCGELFVIYRARGGKEYIEITGVEVLKFDFLLMEWTPVDSAEDRVFFVDEKATYSYRTVNRESEGNRIHFTLADRSIYSYHIQENTVSVSLPFPDLKSPWSSPVWVMPNSRLSATVYGELKHELDEGKVESRDEEAKETDRLSELPLEILSSIACCLNLDNYNNFRLVNKSCRSVTVAPRIRVKELVKDSVTPWLIFCKKGEDKCKFFDPLRLESSTCLMCNPNESKEVRMCCSKEGWCLMLQGRHTIYLWNPLTKKSIPLPKPPYLPHYHNDVIIGCEFLSPPDSSHCVVVLICDYLPDIYFDYIDIELQTWDTHFYTDLKVSRNHNPVFYNEEWYFLNTNGILTMVKTEDLSYQIESPCQSFYQSFLLEANGKLLAVFLGFMGKWLKVFELDIFERIWIEVDSVGDQTLYLSRISSFATTATTEEMKNTVCFPRFYRDKLVYYSLDSRKFHCYGSDIILENFYNTKEQLYTGWIEPRW